MGNYRSSGMKGTRVGSRYGGHNDEPAAHTTRYERAMDEAVLENEFLGEGTFSANYGRGLRLDLRAFLRESKCARDVLQSLDSVERFVLLSYFLLRKTEKQLAELVGLNECRFNQFLENLIRKVGALVVFGSKDPEGWASVLAVEGVDSFEVRRSAEGKPSRAIKESKQVKTVDVLVVFLRTRSFLKVGEHFGAYYVDLRRGLETVAERLKAQKGLAALSLGEFIGSQVQFAGVKEEGYAGRMGKLPELIRVQDPEVLGQMVVRVESKEAQEILTPRAIAAVQGGGV